MPQLMLPRTWPGHFRRTVAGELIEFAPGQATEVRDDQYEALIENGDVGTALYPAAVDDKGRARVDQETLDTLRGGVRQDEPEDVTANETGELPEVEASGEAASTKSRRSRRKG